VVLSEREFRMFLQRGAMIWQRQVSCVGLDSDYSLGKFQDLRGAANVVAQERAALLAGAPDAIHHYGRIAEIRDTD